MFHRRGSNLRRWTESRRRNVMECSSRYLRSRFEGTRAIGRRLGWPNQPSPRQATRKRWVDGANPACVFTNRGRGFRSEEHPSELQTLMRSPNDVLCLQKKKPNTQRSEQTAQTQQE